MLQNASFGPIANLGAPDGLLQLGSVTVNLLPILMTVINLVSGAIYLRGFPVKSKVQQYVLALLFLVLLYNRPAGLVLYWTINNVFALVKNIFMKVLRHPERDFAVCMSVCGAAFLALTAGRIHGGMGMLIVVLIAIVMQLPLVSWLLSSRFPGGLAQAAESAAQSAAHSISQTAAQAGVHSAARKVSQVFMRAGVRGEMQPQTTVLFFLGGVVLTLLAGVLIPLSVLSNSPSEFIRVEAYVTPMKYVLDNTAAAAGFFLLWCGVFYLLAPSSRRGLFALCGWIVSVCSLVNYMFFSRNFGNLSADLVFESAVGFGRKAMVRNALVMLLLAVVLWLIWKARRSLVRNLYVILIVVISALSVYSMTDMNRVIAKIPGLKAASEEGGTGAYEPVFRLSRTGRNVIVLMMDRMISAYVPYIMNEKPELKEKFAGFTWYPNTLSFGVCTNYGSPALFGGYEYTPLMMNRRSGESLGSKQNELLKMMPVLFDNNGFEVTVCDPPYAGYQSVPDLSIYSDYPDIQAYNLTHTGTYSHELQDRFGDYYEKVQKRNFIFYSLFRMVPTAFQKAVYDNGRYLSSSRNANVNQKFIHEYGALCHLSDMTGVTDEAQDTFLMMTNKTTHEKTSLQMPDYEPALTVNNKPYMDPSLWTVDGVTMKMKTKRQKKHYCVNMAAMLKLGDWFDYMREMGVYDNTRIIIVADHGALNMKQFDHMKFSLVDVTAFNPMLMVKDFGADEFTTDRSFMTNGDTPSLAVQGVIENPVNPFTGNAINMDAKAAGPQVVTTSRNWRLPDNHGNVFDTADGDWLSVHDDIFTEENWAYAAPGSEVLKG